MIQLQIDRFDQGQRLLAMRQPTGNRFLLISFGERESADISSALRGEPYRSAQGAPALMSDIEHWQATLDSVTICDLVDGVFQSMVRLSYGEQFAEIPARTAEAIRTAIDLNAPILATPQLLQVAGLYLHPDALENIFAGRTLALEDGQVGPPAIALEQRRSNVLPVLNKYLAPTGWALVSLTVFSTTVELLVAVILHFSSVRLQMMAGRLALYIAMYAVAAILAGSLIFLLRANENQEHTLEVFPVGLRVGGGKHPLRVGWSAFARAGELAQSFNSSDGLLYWQDTQSSASGIALSPYEPNWRDGEIGRLIRRYAPRLLGVQPVDPDAGRPIF